MAAHRRPHDGVLAVVQGRPRAGGPMTTRPPDLPAGVIVCGGTPTDAYAEQIRRFADALDRHAWLPQPQRARAIHDDLQQPDATEQS